jgi:hypothetical protein
MSTRYKMRFCRHDQKYRSYDKWKKLCLKQDSYVTLESKTLSELLPESFIKKSNYVVIMGTETSGSSVFVANFNRIDPNSSGSQIDQHPYIVAFNHSDSTCIGGFLEHGNWNKRTTTYFDPVLWDIVSGSGLLNHLPIAELPEKPSGNIADLLVPSQHEAFTTALQSLLQRK